MSHPGIQDILTDTALSAFREIAHGTPEARISFAPGRVNIIGEHIDYNGLPVLPFATDAGTSILFAPGDEPVVRLMAVSMNNLPPLAFRLDEPVTPFTQGHWGNYVKAAAADVVRFAGERGASPPLRGMKGIVAGNLPVNAGVSSSSSLVVAAMLALHHCQGWEIPPLETAERAADAERFVGTRGGGMDQAASLCGRAGHAMKISFFPLWIAHVPVPEGYVFLTAHCLADARKSGEAMHSYNRRVLECRLITFLVREHLAEMGCAQEDFHRLGDLARVIPGRAPQDWRHDLKGIFEETPMDKHGMETMMKQAVERDSVFRRDFTGWDGDVSRLRIAARARYLFGEWERVERSAILLREGRMAELGVLLLSAMRALRDDYEVSHPNADRLVDLAQASGIAGARIMGAGFGGCTLHAVREEGIEKYEAYLDEQFYHPMTGQSGRTWMRRFRPGAGAGIEKIDLNM